MKIIVIVNNYGQIYDGIGMYSYNLVQELKKIKVEVDILTGNAKVKINSWELFLELLKYFIKNIFKNKKKIFIIEYPFYEWNPFTILLFLIYKLKFRNSIFILSLHEYKRVNIFRKVIIKFLLKLSNYVITTFNDELEEIKEKIIMRRFIPSNIRNINFLNKENIRNKNKYCYFGLINGSKAFQEMLEAWKKFNIDKKYMLEIYTATEIKNFNLEDESIKVYLNLDNEKLSKKIYESEFMILPIKPYIDMKNGSLLAALEHKIIPIGIFHNSLPNIGVKILGDSYTKDNIYESLIKSKTLSEKLRQNLRNEGEKFLKDKTFKEIARNMEEVLKKV